MKTIIRRQLLRCFTLGALAFLGPSLLAAANSWERAQLQYFRGQEVLARILAKSTADNWQKLPIGELVGKVAVELKGTPCVPSTLEVSRYAEFCVVNLKGLDCVTFFENSLCLARMIKHGKSSPEDLINEVQTTRYRDGKMGDFTTRLHYTTDWFVDNEKKGVVKILTPELPGAEPFTQRVGYMTQHPESYRQIKAHPEYMPAIKEAEDRVNDRSLKYLPMNKLKDAEPFLQTGDIVGVTTTKAGIDIGHCGICIKDKDGVIHFMDASSLPTKMRVTLEPEISTCLNWATNLTGVMIVRPLEVGKLD